MADRDAGGRVRLAVTCVAVAGLAILGGWLLLSAFTAPARYEDAPLPSPFSVLPDGEEASGEFETEPSVGPGDSSVTPLTMEAGHLLVPSLGIYAPLVPGEVSTDSLRIPSDPAKLTVYSGGAAACSDEGTVLLAGHVASHGVRGALWPLSGLAPGAAAYVSCADGTVTRWTATAVDVNRKAELPQDVFAPTGELRLVVVTCGGPVMPDGHYRDNVRAYFAPADG